MAYAEIAMAVASSLIKEHEKREQAAQDQAIARQIVTAISAKIEQSKEEILQRLEQLRLQELEGVLIALEVNVVEYDVDGSPDSKDLLDFIINNRAASLLGSAEAIVRDISSNPDFALLAYPILAFAVGVRSWAMTERKYTFGKNSDDDIKRMLEKATSHANAVSNELRRKTDRRFSGPSVRSEGVSGIPMDFLVGYTFDNRFVDVVISSGRPPTQSQLDRAKKSMESHKARVFEAEVAALKEYVSSTERAQGQL